VTDFYKVYGYTCLYASFERVPITSLTVTFVESRHPQKLLQHLRDERGYTVAENHPGIYTISGDILPIQVINSSRLPADENLWLKSLSNRLDISALSRINEEVSRQDKAAQIAAYLDVIIRANTKAVKEIIKMNDVPLEIAQALEEAGWTARWEARGESRGVAKGRAEGEARGRTEGALAIAQNMVNLGLPLETVVSATQLKPEQVQTMYRNN
jgi:hypothetical protein